MRKKYLLFPGYVISQNDGDRHYINAIVLARLYSINLSECIVCDRSVNFHQSENLISLYPDSTGVYKITEAENGKE